MQSILLGLTTLIAPALLLWAAIPSAWLNRRAAAGARVAERQAWFSLSAALIAGAVWVQTGRASQTFAIGFLDEAWLGARLDALSVPILLLIAFLAAVILRFSRNYMAGDDRHGHFTKWMCVTLGSVSALAVAPGLAQFLLAWVATSLSLHKLLVFFPQRHGTLFSARKKFLISRLADASLLAAFAALYARLGSQSFDSVLEGIASSESGAFGGVAWLVAFSAILKSAQFPFHTWLPDTMGTPTPVSALMHAGIINAGGILLIRFSPLYGNVAGPLYAIAIVGAITAVFASFVMLSQTSVKRALAYSTIAQMGFMLLQCGFGAFHLALLHIVAHSLYKAHSFLSSGSSVASIQKMESAKPMETRSLATLFTALAASFSIVFALVWVLGLDEERKPGVVVFSVVVASAISHLLWRTLRQGSSFLGLTSSVGLAAALAASYFALAVAALWWMEPLYLQAPFVSPLFEAIIAVLLLLALVTSAQLQSGASGLLSDRIRSTLYVHALNGFYANAIANRTIRFLRLHPDRTR